MAQSPTEGSACRVFHGGFKNHGQGAGHGSTIQGKKEGAGWIVDELSPNLPTVNQANGKTRQLRGPPSDCGHLQTGNIARRSNAPTTWNEHRLEHVEARAGSWLQSLDAALGQGEREGHWAADTHCGNKIGKIFFSFLFLPHFFPSPFCSFSFLSLLHSLLF